MTIRGETSGGEARGLPKREQLALAWRLLLRNPRVFSARLVSRVRGLLGLPRRSTLMIGGVKFTVDSGLGPGLEHQANGTYEWEVVEVLRRYLRPGDVFIDVGANIGYLTAVGMDRVGRLGCVHAFEPVPRYYNHLCRLGRDNPGYSLVANRFALGAGSGKAEIAVAGSMNIGWNTMVPRFIDASLVTERVEVEIRRLDDYLEDHRINEVRMIKIDTEGYEFPVLQGLSGYLDRRRDRPVIMCEIAPMAYSRLGLTVPQLLAYLGDYGYGVCDLDGREMGDLTTAHHTCNVLLLQETGKRSS